MGLLSKIIMTLSLSLSLSLSQKACAFRWRISHLNIYDETRNFSHETWCNIFAKSCSISHKRGTRKRSLNRYIIMMQRVLRQTVTNGKHGAGEHFVQKKKASSQLQQSVLVSELIFLRRVKRVPACLGL